MADIIDMNTVLGEALPEIGNLLHNKPQPCKLGEHLAGPRVAAWGMVGRQRGVPPDRQLALPEPLPRRGGWDLSQRSQIWLAFPQQGACARGGRGTSHCFPEGRRGPQPLWVVNQALVGGR